MSKSPAILFYTSDFLTGTAFFTDEQRGQYIKLLCEQHQNGHIPEQHMINICKSYDSPVFKKFVKDSGGLFFNKKMEEVSTKRQMYLESRQKNRTNKHKDNISKTYVPTYEKHMSIHMENENENENEYKNKEEYEGKKEKEPDEILTPKDAEILFDEVIEFFPDDIKPKTQHKKSEWISTLDKLIRIDKHSPEIIKQVIESTRKDDFWKSNFLSLLKLRRKDPDGNMYFTVFKNRINGNNRTTDRRQIKRVNKLWDKED